MAGQICDKCGTDITDKVASYSKQHYGKELCFDCQKEAKKTDTGKKVEEGADTPQELFEGKQKTNRNHKEINKDFIVKIGAKEFITANGLLAIAEAEGGIESISVRDAVFDMVTGAAWATVFIRMKDGREFSDCGSGTPANLKKGMGIYPLEMAVTRARSRALRFGLNVDYISLEELNE